jgi:hypothetical protein
VHYFLIAIYEDWDYFREGFGFENQSGDTPFEVAQRLLWMLVYATFGEDVDPRVLAGGVIGWGGKGIVTVGAVSQGAG